MRGGAVVDLGAAPRALRLLSALARAGGALDKETLARRVWQLREYHPLRDDKRIQVAVRKLRLRIEDEPSRPRRLVTTADGYALGAETPLRWLCESDDPVGPGPGGNRE